MQSFAIVRGDENADGTFTWIPLIGDQERDGARYTFGIDPERTRSGASQPASFTKTTSISASTTTSRSPWSASFSTRPARAAMAPWAAWIAAL